MSSISGIASVSAAKNLYQPNTVQSKLSQAATNFQSIGDALQAGDITSARTAMAAFQQYAISSNGTHQPFPNNSQANSDYNMLARALKEGDLTTAQKTFSALQADLQAGGKMRHWGDLISKAAGSASASTESTSFSNVLSKVLNTAS